MSVNTKAIIRKGTTIEMLVDALELKYSNVIVTPSSYDSSFFSITFTIGSDKRRLAVSYYDTIDDYGIDGVWMSLGCVGESVNIMHYLCDTFGGYLDENDCDDDGFYPISFHLFSLGCDNIQMSELTNKIISKLGYDNLKEALLLFEEYKTL